MLGWVVDVVGTFALSLVSACVFLRLRCRGVGPPFGPRARYWASIIVVGMAAVSTGVGLVIVAASQSAGAAYVGLIVPSGLWLGRASAPREKQRIAWSVWPLSRLYERMGDDMDNWCATRLTAASEKPQWISDAARYYSDQVEGRLKDSQARAKVSSQRESIMHKIKIVQLINLDTTPARVQDELQSHPSTRDLRKYADKDFQRLARRLVSDAETELNLYLKDVYRLGHHQLLIYPFRLAVHRR